MTVIGNRAALVERRGDVLDIRDLGARLVDRQWLRAENAGSCTVSLSLWISTTSSFGAGRRRLQPPRRRAIRR